MTDAGRAAIDRRAAALGLGAGLALAGAPARGQTAAIEILAPGAPGDGHDQLARAIAEGLGVIKLTPRAIAVNGPPDDQALLEFVDGKRPRAGLMIVGLSSLGVFARTNAGRALETCRPVARLLGEQLPIVVPANSPIKSLRDLMDALARDPAALPWSGRGFGSADHQLAILLTKAAGGDPSRLAYRPAASVGEASMQVLTGKAPVAVGPLLEYWQQIRGGTLRALALASPERSADVDVATLRELGVDVAVVNWRGVVSRDSVGRSLVERFTEAIERLSRLQGWGELLANRHWTALYQPPDVFRQFLLEERDRVAQLMRSAGAAR